MKIIDRIKNRETLTPAENEIVSFIRDNTEMMVNMSLEELADTIYVSKSTIIRFCKKFGFHGHKELCVELAKELNSFAADELDMDISTPFARGDTPADAARKMTALTYRAVNDTFASLSIEKLTDMARMIRSAQQLTIYASEDTWLAAMDFAGRLQSLGYQAHAAVLTASPLKTAVSQNENCPALFIAYSVKEPLLVQCARILARRNVPVCLITNHYTGTVGRLFAAAVETGVYEPQPRYSLGAARTGVMLALDILYAVLFNMDYEKNVGIMNAAADARSAQNENTEQTQ